MSSTSSEEQEPLMTDVVLFSSNKKRRKLVCTKSIVSCKRRKYSHAKVSSLSRYESLQQSDAVKLPEPPKEGLLPFGSLNSHSARRLRMELEHIMKDPTPNVSAHLKEDNLYEWEATIEGPPDSPYEGGTFFLDVILSEGYPFKPPRVNFRTKVYHCNINSDGWISLSTLLDWSPAMTISKLLLSIQSLLTDCNPDDPLVPEIAAQYVDDREEHDIICREWTKKYASDE